MKNDFAKSKLVKKALDALRKQAIRDEATQQLKGGGGEIGHGQTAGMIHEL